MIQAFQAAQAGKNDFFFYFIIYFYLRSEINCLDCLSPEKYRKTVTFKLPEGCLETA